MGELYAKNAVSSTSPDCMFSFCFACFFFFVVVVVFLPSLHYDVIPEHTIKPAVYRYKCNVNILLAQV